MRAGWPGLALAVLLAGGAHAQGDAPATVVSARPDHVAVTIYRAPGRATDEDLPKFWLSGYALVSEEREIDLPAGAATLRFEGVAAGMLAESAIISGLPAGVSEKNLDAELLSPHNLYARAFGRPVVLRRRHPGSGQVEEEPAIIRSGPDGAAVVQTRAGFEMVDCGGLKDSIAWQGLPPGLNARPTLSVATHTDHAQRVKLHLSYLAWGFDWQAHYVLSLAPGAREARMTAWLTLASSDDTSFPDATASVVAGQPHFDETRVGGAQDGELELTCGVRPLHSTYPPPPPPAPMAAAMMDIVVTGARRMAKADYTARAETLGDLHLYRLPFTTTVAAHAQKQAALLAGRRVKLVLVHAAIIDPDGESEVRMLVRMRNLREDGLGLALPAGRVSVLQQQGQAAISVGEGAMTDRAERETIDVDLAGAPLVHALSQARAAGKDRQRVRVTVTNANRWPVRFEGRLAVDEDERLEGASARLGRKDGKPLWSATVPAQGKAVLIYTLRQVEP
jgi:hypothetical protein